MLFLNYLLYSLGLTTELEYSCFEEHITCTVYGGLVDYYNWTKDGVLIDSSDLKFQQFMRITDSVLVTTQVILSSSNRSYFQGTFRCTVRDGLGRTSYSTINFNSKNPKYKVLIISVIYIHSPIPSCMEEM